MFSMFKSLTWSILVSTCSVHACSNSARRPFFPILIFSIGHTVSTAFKRFSSGTTLMIENASEENDTLWCLSQESFPFQSNIKESQVRIFGNFFRIRLGISNGFISQFLISLMPIRTLLDTPAIHSFIHPLMQLIIPSFSYLLICLFVHSFIYFLSLTSLSDPQFIHSFLITTPSIIFPCFYLPLLKSLGTFEWFSSSLFVVPFLHISFHYQIFYLQCPCRA